MATAARGPNPNDDAVLQKLASKNGVLIFEEDVVKGVSKKTTSSLKAALNRLKASGAVALREIPGDDGSPMTVVWNVVPSFVIPKAAAPPPVNSSAAPGVNIYKRPHPAPTTTPLKSTAAINTPFKAPVLTAKGGAPALKPSLHAVPSSSSLSSVRQSTPGLRRIGFRTPIKQEGARHVDSVRTDLRDQVAKEEEKLRKLRMAKRYREKNDLRRLGELTAKWKSVCQQALLALHYQLPGNPSIAELLIGNQIDPKVVSFDANDETFVS